MKITEIKYSCSSFSHSIFEYHIIFKERIHFPTIFTIYYTKNVMRKDQNNDEQGYKNI